MFAKKTVIRMVVLLLVSVMCFAAVGCNNGTPAVTTDPTTQNPASDGTTVADTTEADTTEADTTPAIDVNTLPLKERFDVKDYEGTSIFFITGGDNDWWVNYDIIGPDNSGEILSEAIFNRNAEIEGAYNVVIKHEQRAHHEAFNQIKADAAAGDTNFDSFFCNGTQMRKLVNASLTANLNEIEAFNFDDPWWNDTVNETLNWGGKHRLVAMGDMNIMSWKTTACIMYNYTLGNKEGVENCFELVRSGKWTMDKWNQIMLDFSRDLDNNGTMDYKTDRYGLVTGNQTLEYSMNGMGETFVSVDAEGYPAVFSLSERMLNALEKVTKLYSKESCLNVHDSSYSGGVALNGQSAKLFSEGRFLFFAETIGGSFQLWNMQDDYGFLPFPKYDETQENYNSSIQSAQMSVVMIPRHATVRRDATADVINAMGYLNMRDVKDVFYDSVFGTRSVRDEDSMEMLEIILQDRTFDLGVAVDFGSIVTEVRKAVIAGNGNYASTYESYREAAETAFAKWVANAKK